METVTLDEATAMIVERLKYIALSRDDGAEARQGTFEYWLGVRVTLTPKSEVQLIDSVQARLESVQGYHDTLGVLQDVSLELNHFRTTARAQAVANGTMH